MSKILRLFVLLLLAFILASCSVAEEEKSGSKIIIRTTESGIETGRKLFVEKCIFCHDRKSTKTLVGPGLLGILNKSELPTSKKPATPENIENQLRNPYKDMPSFDYLSDEDVEHIIQYLNTF